MKVSDEIYQISRSDIREITLENEKGMSVSFLNYGGIITKIRVPDRNGHFSNVVLSHRNPEDYLENPGYFGALIGRTAGRIKDGYFDLEGSRYVLAKNYGENSGHGGIKGFDKMIFSIDHDVENDRGRIHLTCKAKDMEEGYPGALTVQVTYTLTEDNTFRIDYEAQSDRTTLVNMTNHSYFNLSGDFQERIEMHRLQMAAKQYAELDETSAPTGRLLDVEGSPFDFRALKHIGADIGEDDPQLVIGKGYDHPFLLDRGRDEEEKVRLIHEGSGRVMEIRTDNEAVVFYSQNYTQGQTIQNGEVLPERISVALEVQRLPIGQAGSFLSHSILKEGEIYRTFTEYRFYVE